jgi:peptide/nickel transport system substrate-binding protein
MKRVVAWVGLATALASPWASPAQAGRDLFVVDQVQNAASLDPHVQWDPDSYFVYRNVFDNIVTRDPTGKIVPQVASAWSYPNDTTLKLTIRDDISFHDGSKLTPDDVVFSIRRITDPAFKSPQLSQYDSILSVDVTGPHEVTLMLKRAYPVLLAQLTKLSIVPRAMVEKLGNEAFNGLPMGSGPYRIVSATRGVRTELAANPGYWRGPPPFPRVEFRPVPDESTRLANLRSGRSDITRILLTDNAIDLKNDAQLKVLWSPVERVTMVALNAMVGPTKDVRVREAIAHAIDRDLIVEALLKGYARTVDQIMPPSNFGYAEGLAGFSYDPAKSRALLKEAGIAPGTKISFPTAPSFDQRVVQALHQMLTDVGLDPQISSSDIGTYLRLRQGRPEEAGDVSFFRWSCGCQDADGVLFPLFHSSSQWSKYRNATVDGEIDAARSTLDETARLSHYRRALTILHDEVAAVPLYQDSMMFAARKEVTWKPTPNEAFFLMDMSWTP